MKPDGETIMGAGAEEEIGRRMEQVDATKATPKKGNDWEARWLEVFSGCCNVRLACHAAGIDRCTAYRRRQQSTRFRAAWDTAREDALDLLEADAWKRARESSDTLLIFLLKSGRPEKYADRLIILQKIAREVQNANDDDLLRLLGYDGAGEPDPAAAGAGRGEP